ncbi:MAG: alpha-hydroxy-acid oxidizing protein [Gammaproteobacteria bacterium]|nr:alpha-hydroxy-acid oxidizing protein [Gammaproteobacteria bacterium]
MNYDIRFPSVADLKRRARMRMPGFAFDYVDAGIDDEKCKARNRDAWHRVQLIPRYLRDVSAANLQTRLFGREYAMPFGVSPVGLGNMMWPGAERALARAAQLENIPYILSTFGTTALEEIAATAPDVCWFQLYVPKKEEVMEDLLRRARDANCHALVVTLDIPVGAKRNRELKNALKLPFAPTPKILRQCLARPAWLLRTLMHGAPDFATVARYREGANENLADFITRFNMHGVTRERLEKIRALWDGPMILKGLQHTEDLRAAAEIGVDGVIISNHGGRQLDAAPASAESLRAVPDEIRERLTLMADGGIRSGLDVIRAKALGAQAAFSGRAFFWGVGALGARGAAQVAGIFRDEMERALRQLGCGAFEKMDRSWLAD